jgi:lipoate-protein ligase A
LNTESLSRTATAEELHAVTPIRRDGVRLVRCIPESMALVLGSRQSERLIDLKRAAQRNVEVIRRRSGGGIVLVDPHRSLWIDIEIGADDPRYIAEPLGMMEQVGRWWLAALRSLDCALPDIWQVVGQTGSDANGELVCFAGRSHGELMVEESKLVGLSQRRTRDGARVQGQLHFVDPTDEILALIVEGYPGRPRRPAIVDEQVCDVCNDRFLDALTSVVSASPSGR